MGTDAAHPGESSAGGIAPDSGDASSPPFTFCHYPSIPPPVPVRLTDTGEHPCSYLPDRLSRNRGFWAESLAPRIYQGFMNANFRRSGKIVYQPACNGCRKCVSIRVPVTSFQPSKSQRRAWRKNQDLIVTSGPAIATEESFQLYQRYLKDWHGKASDDADEDTSQEEFVAFLYDSPVETLEYQYRDAGGRLLAVGICDISDAALSTVYFFHDPEHAARSLGTFGALCEIESAKVQGIPYYYLGYWVDGCGSMAYKATYRPYELLHPDGVWLQS